MTLLSRDCSCLESTPPSAIAKALHLTGTKELKQPSLGLTAIVLGNIALATHLRRDSAAVNAGRRQGLSRKRKRRSIRSLRCPIVSPGNFKPRAAQQLEQQTLPATSLIEQSPPQDRYFIGLVNIDPATQISHVGRNGVQCFMVGIRTRYLIEKLVDAYYARPWLARILISLVTPEYSAMCDIFLKRYGPRGQIQHLLDQMVKQGIYDPLFLRPSS